MSQISMPIRIVLVGAIVFMAAWFTVLRPGTGDTTVPAPAPSAPGSVSSKPGEFAAKAKAGAATAEKDAAGAANATLEDNGAAATAPSAGATAAQSAVTAGTTTTAQAPAPPALTGKALEKLPVPIRRALKQEKVLVLGVLNTEAKSWAPMADDDREVRDALKHVNRYDGEVAVQTAPVGKLARYEGLLSALAVNQTPTIVIVDKDRHATALSGYWDRVSLNQAIVDAHRVSTETLIKDKFLARVNRECGRRSLRFDRLSHGGSLTTFGKRLRHVGRLYARRVEAIPAPARWRPLRNRMAAGFRRGVTVADSLAAAFVANDAAKVRRVLSTDLPALAAEGRALNHRFNVVGLTNCSWDRTQ
ncbi:MAG TPA: hypothetical protein VF533_10545 [Solirubrobacteraceae bacterium]